MESNRVCIWCDTTKNVNTREHLVPSFLGGQSGLDNISYACHPCNNERGKLTSYYATLQYYYKFFGKWDQLTVHRKHWLKKAFNRFHQKSETIEELKKKWVKLEIDKMGHSPHEKLDFSVPPPAKLAIIPSRENSIEFRRFINDKLIRLFMLMSHAEMVDLTRKTQNYTKRVESGMGCAEALCHLIADIIETVKP